MASGRLQRRAHEARNWLFDACFPLWSTAGMTETGLFAEKLSLDHAPIDVAETRVRVQARQTYVFSAALELGWQTERARDCVKAGVATLSGPAKRDDGLYGRSLDTTTLELQDETADLYDIAFSLFGLAAAANALQANGAPAQAAARAGLSAAEVRLRDTVNGGFAETLPPPDVRLQNPHMHLLEALLLLHKADRNGGHLERAGAILSLFLTRLTAGEGGLLGERFAPDWSMPQGEDADIVEPGHQFEWVWLLHALSRAQGAALPPEAETLYAFALSTLDSEGRACQAVRRDGSIVDGSRRTWPQTEAMKAHLAMYEVTGRAAHAELAAQSFDVLMDEYLTAEGGWLDHFDAEGQLLSTDMPASTGYHVVLAFSELIRVAGS